jgi:hypothetical protein
MRRHSPLVDIPADAGQINARYDFDNSCGKGLVCRLPGVARTPTPDTQLPMRNPYPFTLTTLLACGPTVASPADATETTDASTNPTTTTTDLPPSTTTTALPTTTDPSNSTDPTPANTTALDFIHRPDLDPNAPAECDIFAQDCPRGQKCAPWANDGGSSWNALKCVDIIGDGQPGDPCTAPNGPLAGLDDCALGVYCWEVDDRNHGTCIPLCLGTPEKPECPPDNRCDIHDDGVLTLCLPQCDPFLQDCAGTDLCLPDFEGFFRCLIDASGAEGQVNDPCEFANSCDKGLLCINTPSASSACDAKVQGCCQPYCKLPDAPCPNPDQQCVPLFGPDDDIPPDSEDVGVCGLPK